MVLFPVNQLPLRARAHVVKILQLATRMATTISTLQEFRPTEEDIAAYLECVELYFKANDITESKQVAVFLTVAGRKVYALLMRSPRTREAQHQNLQGVGTDSQEPLRAQASSYSRNIFFPLTEPEVHQDHC